MTRNTSVDVTRDAPIGVPHDATLLRVAGLEAGYGESQVLFGVDLEVGKGEVVTLLSGGEQQMLAIGRALMTNPRLLILDEATEGLAPLIRHEIWRCLERLKAAGQSILVIDKNIDALARIADRHYILEKGRIVWSGSSALLDAQRELRERYLGV